MPYTVWNGPAPTTAAQQSVTTGTSIKTMLQLATPSTRMIQILEWGFSLDDPPGADGVVELLQTDVAATVTAHVASGVINLDPNGTASLLSLGTSATGYTATAEGSTTAARVFDAVSLSSVSGESGLSYVRTFMPDDRPIVAVSRFLRVRATTPTTASDMRCFVTFQEVG
ncbi:MULTISPECIES: hypothetical protein [Streptomyces]|uniref:Minor tail protein n=2 Tax=Streptomyces TaxID=1883 RepID=A0ABS9JHK6_9ACTN|nr:MULTISPECIES: hypothetical protein [Streptomyces]MCG0065041.1 hypothetical protein [Streptomyces tricolor]BCM70852.1 hypothetical protein EASAB2608_06186 [Streptomyces sp. EAS-AB2608]